MIIERYRKDYVGEFIITNTSWSGGKKRTQREWMPNPIENHHISGRAACIASSADLSEFDFTVLEHHKGGLLGSLKLQTYGTGEIAKMMRLDFTVEKDDIKLTELFDLHYYKQNIIYTTPRQCLRHPGVFYTIPYNPPFIKEVLLPYLAAFDGHKEIFIIGANQDLTASNSSWQEQIGRVIDLYRSTQFVAVGNPGTIPEAWYNSPNFKSIDYRNFISHCDC